MSGLLDTLLGRPTPMGPEWNAFLKTRGLQAGQDIGAANVAKLIADYTDQQKANSQAPAVAKQLGRAFGQPQVDQTDAAGYPAHVSTGDPQAANMVGLMMDPNTRQAGLAGAMQLLAPQDAQQRATLAQNDEQFNRSFAQADQLAQQRMAQDAAQFGKTYALDQERTRATINNMSMDNAAKLSDLQIKAAQLGYQSENTLRDQYQKNPLVQKAQLALTSYNQLINALDQNNPTALGAAIVAITQVQEPGLAVREDDRIRYAGSNPLITQLAQMANQASATGHIDPLIRQRMVALGTQLAAPHAMNYERIKADYAALALKAPGGKPERVVTGTGIDETLVNYLHAVATQGQ